MEIVFRILWSVVLGGLIYGSAIWLLRVELSGDIERMEARKSVASRGTGLDQCSCDSCYRGNGWKTSGRKQTGDPRGTGDPVLPAGGRFVSGGLHGCCTQLCV